MFGSTGHSRNETVKRENRGPVTMNHNTINDGTFPSSAGGNDRKIADESTGKSGGKVKTAANGSPLGLVDQILFISFQFPVFNIVVGGFAVFVVMSLLLPGVGSGPPGKRTMCKNNLKQIGLALHNYHDWHGSFPPAVTRNEQGEPLLSWRVLLLPYLDNAELYSRFHLDEPWDSPHNASLIKEMPAVYTCPSTPELIELGKTSYLIVRHDHEIASGGGQFTRDHVTDPQSATLQVLEVHGMEFTWTSGIDIVINPLVGADGLWPDRKIANHHIHGLMIDGTVKYIPPDISGESLYKLSTIRGNDPVEGY